MIGVFDSGMGGLTVLKALRAELPSADILYFGDIKHAPYGQRSHEELSRLTLMNVQFLLERGATAVVSACNSASATLAFSLLDTFSLTSQQILEMVGPTVAACRGYRGRIALTATVATVNSGIYQSAFHMIGSTIQTFPIPDLAGAIESGASETVVRELIARTFSGHEGSFDLLILACTHYPIVIEQFKKVLPGVTIFDPSQAVAERARTLFWPREVSNGELRFVISSDSTPFRDQVARMFEGERHILEVLP